jgi:FkbM family methyltransferase
MINILLVIPSKNPRPETLDCVLGLSVPEGYKLTTKLYDGYKTNIYNQCAGEVLANYDYLFFVETDVLIHSDMLFDLLKHNKDIISAAIPQKNANTSLLEAFDSSGGVIKFEEIFTKRLIEPLTVPMACCLISKNAFASIPFPWFVDNNNASTDYFFFMNAKNYGISTYIDPFVQCSRIGDHIFKLKNLSYAEARMRELYMQDLLPAHHVDYLSSLKANGFYPEVVYDIGACVLHWTKRAKTEVWNEAKYFCFEAMEETEFLYKEFGVDGYYNGVLTDSDNKFVDFYKSIYSPGGNSYYLENQNISGGNYYNESTKYRMRGMSLDTIVHYNNFPLPNLIKMDVQGAELDIVKGASKCIEHADHLILELQNIDYNMGAPKAQEVIEYLQTVGYELIQPAPFCLGPFDGDYHFIKAKK